MNILFRNTGTNWWLWIFLTLSGGVYMTLFVAHAHGTLMASDWEYLIGWFRDAGSLDEFWNTVVNILIIDFGPPFVIGFFIQFFIMLLWNTRGRRRRQEKA